MKLTPEIIAKAKTARNAEELIEMAKTEGFSNLTAEEAAKFYEQLNPKRGEIADDELDNVAAGCICESSVSADWLALYHGVCPKCGSTHIRGIPATTIGGKIQQRCYGCGFITNV